jgi:hypothetical protein
MTTKASMNKNIYLLIFSLTSLFFAHQSQAQIPVGQSQPIYKTINDVASFYNGAPLTADLVFELQEDYQPSSETYPITFNQNAGNFSVVIQKKPGAFSITNSGSGVNGLIVWSGADKLSLQNPTGGGSWTIQNTATSGPTLLLQNNAENNTIRNLVLEGRATNNGVVSILNSTTGSSGNRIENNRIQPYTGGERSLTIRKVANHPDKVDLYQTKIKNTVCTQLGGTGSILVTTQFPHNLVAGVPVKIDKVCGTTLANGNHTVASINSDTTFTILVSGTCPVLAHNISLLEPLNVIRDLKASNGKIKVQVQFAPDFANGDKVKISDVRGMTDANGIYVVDSVDLVAKTFVVSKATTQTDFKNTYIEPIGPKQFVFSPYNGAAATKVKCNDTEHGFQNIPGQKVRFLNTSVPFGTDVNYYNNQIFDVNYIDTVSFWISKPYQDAITVGANFVYEEGGFKNKRILISEIYNNYRGGRALVTAEPHGLGMQTSVRLYHSGHPSQDANGLITLTVNRLSPYSFDFVHNNVNLNSMVARAATVQKLDNVTEKPFTTKEIYDGVGYEPISRLSLPGISLKTIEPNAVISGQPFVVSGAINVDDVRETFDIYGGETNFNGYHTALASSGSNNLVLHRKTAKGNYCPAHFSTPLVVHTQGAHSLSSGAQLVIQDETDISGLNGKKTITVLNDSAFYINGSAGQLYKMDRGNQLGTYRQFRVGKGGHGNNGTKEFGTLFDRNDRVHGTMVGINYSPFTWTSGDSVEVSGAI